MIYPDIQELVKRISATYFQQFLIEHQIKYSTYFMADNYNDPEIIRIHYSFFEKEYEQDSLDCTKLTMKIYLGGYDISHNYEDFKYKLLKWIELKFYA
jgi:hypothetical protein